MKLTKIYNNNLNFLSLWKVCGLLLLLVGISSQSFGQIYVGENAVISVQEGTVIHISDDKTNESQKAKIYVGKNTQLTNFPSDSLVEIVYLAKENQPETAKAQIPQKKPKKPLQPPIIKEDTEPENRTGVLSFASGHKSPSALFYAGKTTKAALAQSNHSVKLFQAKIQKENTSFTFISSDKLQIKENFLDSLRKSKLHLEDNITRPPPFLSKSQPEIA